jgi:predicted dehydrogenase
MVSTHAVRGEGSAVIPSDLAPVNVAVLGYGYWGPNLARNVTRHDATNLAAIADLSEERLLDAKKDHPWVRLTTDVTSVLADDQIEAVVIATPPETHYPLAKRALERGKHVLVEKPLATSVGHAEDLVRLADAHCRQLLVDHTFLFTGAVRRMKEYFDAGEIGDVYYYDSTRINLGLFQHNTNVVWDLAPHDLSIMLHLIDEPVVKVSAVGSGHLKRRVENIAYITLQFESQLLAHFHVNWLAPAKVRRTIIGGSKKMLVFDDMEASEKLRVYDSGARLCASEDEIYRSLVEYRTGDVVAPKLDKTEALTAETGHVANVIRGLEPPISDGAFGLEIVRILAAAQESLDLGGVPVEVPR